MSPTCQQKFCNAWTGIDLCGVQRPKTKINLEDRSMLTTDRKLKSRTSSSFTSKGVVKSTESSSPQLRNSSVLLDTKKVVDFSQRQMHDIENIAANLISSLKHMRSLVNETLSSEAHSLLPSFNTAEFPCRLVNQCPVHPSTPTEATTRRGEAGADSGRSGTRPWRGRAQVVDGWRSVGGVEAEGSRCSGGQRRVAAARSLQWTP
ncbi:uncharacterized protein LOC123444933 isoform X1 [Hordeum vulgare subsp. vulgare]|uniref:uncharacterized protein LOC123444933 isoform X1 n=1 Tax=Hordeum vulgare subsp. vulgare TaxID=112509 RepID=UPI000B474D4A|nr:uncharacterized protein LOC123444933 isoform X1 [Hordeum vulgare subsp. vulgare]